ncbi:MAG: hypothetical protein DRP79_03265 [Planctomycetota bacterium]|nr:MAG: hypothetical protein DRP79_03265 [Planctomycetota bacterium]
MLPLRSDCLKKFAECGIMRYSRDGAFLRVTLMSNFACVDCKTCPIRDRCKTICETIERLLPSMEQGRVDYEDLPRIYEGKMVTNLILDNEDLLSPRQQDIVRLYYRESMKQVDIGKALGITQQAVAAALKSVRTRFMRMYRKRRTFYDETERGKFSEIEELPTVHVSGVTDGLAKT